MFHPLPIAVWFYKFQGKFHQLKMNCWKHKEKNQIEVKFNIFLSFSFGNNQIAGVANVSKFNKIAQKLGIPGPPKKPTTGFIRFQQENRNTFQTTSKSQSELSLLAATQWKQLSDEQKEKYNREYKKEYVRHSLFS